MKYIVILVMTLLGYVPINAQHSLSEIGDPIQPYKENGYTVAEVKAFALSPTPKAKWWRINSVLVVNKALIASGETVRVTEENISWILDNTKIERVVLPQGFINSRAFGNVCEFYSDRRGFDGMGGVFRYGKCVLKLFKAVCINLFDVIPDPVLFQTDPIIPAPPLVKIDTTVVTPKPVIRKETPDKEKVVVQKETVIIKEKSYVVYEERERRPRRERRGPSFGQVVSNMFGYVNVSYNGGGGYNNYTNPTSVRRPYVGNNNTITPTRPPYVGNNMTTIVRNPFVGR